MYTTEDLCPACGEDQISPSEGMEAGMPSNVDTGEWCFEILHYECVKCGVEFRDAYEKKFVGKAVLMTNGKWEDAK